MIQRGLNAKARLQASPEAKTSSQQLDWPATLRNKGNTPIQRQHLQFKKKAHEIDWLHCLLLDCSGSMLQDRNLGRAKAVLLSWSQQLYQQRIWMAVIGFAGNQAQIVQPPTKAGLFNERWIAAISGGGGTPIEAAQQQAEKLLQQFRCQQPQARIGLWLMSDGRFQASPPVPSQSDLRVMIDFEQGKVKLGRLQRLAQDWQASYIRAEQLILASPIQPH